MKKKIVILIPGTVLDKSVVLRVVTRDLARKISNPVVSRQAELNSHSKLAG